MQAKDFPVISVTRGMSGHFAVHYWWNPEHGGFPEPYNTGIGRYATREEAIEDPLAIIGGMPERFRPFVDLFREAGEGISHEACSLAGTLGLGKLALDLEKEKLRAFDQQEAFRPVADDLADEFRSDRTAGPRHHHGPAGQKLVQIFVIECDRLAA